MRILYYCLIEAVVVQEKSCECKRNDCGFDSQSRKGNICRNLYFYCVVLVPRQRAALSSATQQAMSQIWTKSGQQRVACHACKTRYNC